MEMFKTVNNPQEKNPIENEILSNNEKVGEKESVDETPFSEISDEDLLDENYED